MERLKQLRESRKILQKTVAEHLGIDRTTYTKYETGKSEPDIQTLIKLSAYFQVSLDELVGNECEFAKKKMKNPLTPHEQTVIAAYRANSAMQSAVDKLLGIK